MKPTRMKQSGFKIGKPNFAGSEARFSSFLVDDSNREAHFAASQISKGGIKKPIFLIADSGLGKTHLLHAIGNQVLENSTTERVALVRCESFVNDVVGAIINRQVGLLRDHYRDNFDVLLVDDFSFMSAKEHSLEELYWMLRDLEYRGGRIAIASSVPIDKMRIKNRAIKSWLNGAWKLTINQPGTNMRERYARQLMAAHGMSDTNPEDAGTFSRPSFREIEAVVIRTKMLELSLKGECSCDDGVS